MNATQKFLLYFLAAESRRKKSKEQIDEERKPKGFVAKHPALSLALIAAWAYVVVRFALLFA